MQPITLIRKELWKLVDKHGTQAKVCDTYKLNRTLFNLVLSGTRPPSTDMCALVGWNKSRIVVYKRKRGDSEVMGYATAHCDTQTYDISLGNI